MILAIYAISQPLTHPVWPNQFEDVFKEQEFAYYKYWEVQGKIYYDYTNRRFREDRDTGRWDKYCGSIYWFSNTPCSHYVIEGNRYIHFPEKNYCCNCCNEQEGCGILKPDWMKDSKFISYAYDAIYRLQLWEGMDPHYQYLVLDDIQQPYRVSEIELDFKTFSVVNFKYNISDPTVFNLPSICDKNKKCPFYSECKNIKLFGN